MKRFLWLALAVLMVVLMAPDGFAQVGGNSNATGSATGNDALGMATYMYCGAKDLLQGYLGLMIGLGMVALGLWALIQGKGLAAGLTVIVFGSLVTAIPSLIEGSLTGLSSILTQAGIATSGFKVVECAQVSVAPVDNSDIDPTDPSKLTVNKVQDQTIKEEEYQAPTIFVQ